MNLSLRHLTSFLAVAEELHFGHAAARLRIAQPALSQQIHRLEGELGIRLFDRTSRRVELTEAGAVFFKEIRHALAKIEEAATAARRAGEGETGELMIGCGLSALWKVVPTIARAFGSRYLDARIASQISSPDQVPAGIINGLIDIGFARYPPLDDALVYETICYERIVVALAESSRLAELDRIPLRRLEDESILMWRRADAPGNYDRIMAIFAHAGVRPTLVEHLFAALQDGRLIAAGEGAMLLPECAPVFCRGIALVPLEEPELLTLTMYWRRDDRSPLLERFVAVARQVADEQGWLAHDGEGHVTATPAEHSTAGARLRAGL